MLNISNNKLKGEINISRLKTFSCLKPKGSQNLLSYLLIGLLILFIILLFLPWTQNIQAKGYVTTLFPDERPQSIQSVISGKIEKWYVREGNVVAKGDTIVYITEVKNEYFDDSLVPRTKEQLTAKEQSILTYESKVRALEQQYNSLQNERNFKLKEVQNKILQAENKIKIAQADFEVQNQNLKVAQNQFSRTKELYEGGLKSLSEFQEKELKLQQTQNKVSVQQNKLYNSENEKENLKIQLSTTRQKYAEKLAKSLSDQQTAISAKLEAEGSVAKLKNKVSNYEKRQEFHYITAPQAGLITKTLKKGLGEIIKEGKDIATIVPSKANKAIEIYISPLDLPLLKIGEQARIVFDGWPAILISGWPEASTGIFTGQVIVVDQFISKNGMYRVLVQPSDPNKPWPKELSLGTGARTFILLKDVSIWYEIWRQLNGFPADFYNLPEGKQGKGPKRKAPIQTIK